MPTLQDTSTLSASRMEHRILEHVKQALRVTLDWKAPVVSMPRKLSSLQFTMKSFERHLKRLMSIEEEGGYMAEVAEMKPHLQDRVDCLACDHDLFRDRIRELVPNLTDINEWEEERFHEACDEIRALLDGVDEHDAREVELIQETLLLDEGGEG